MRSARQLALISIAAMLAACTTSGAAPSASSAPTSAAVASLVATAVPASEPAISPVPSNGVGSGGQSTPGPLDPCSLLTVDEASTLIGTKLGAGVSTTVEPERVCTWKTGLTEVKLFLAPPAPDAATAQGYWDAARSEVPAGMPVQDVAGFDRAAYGGGSAGGMSLSALFVIDGTQFIDLYCGFPMCTETASVTAAQLIVGRLP